MTLKEIRNMIKTSIFPCDTVEYQRQGEFIFDEKHPDGVWKPRYVYYRHSCFSTPGQGIWRCQKCGKYRSHDRSSTYASSVDELAYLVG